MKRIALFLAWTAAVAYGQSGSPVDRLKLESLHDSGKAFQQALADPNATVGKVADSRMKLEHEATRLEGREGSPAEKRIVELYAAAARDYDAARTRFAAEKSRERFLSDLRRIDGELSEAENLFQGGAASPVVPPPAAAPVVPVPAPPPATPRVRKPPPQETVPATPPVPERPMPPQPPPMPPAHSPEPPTHAEPPLVPPSRSASAPPATPRPASPAPPAPAPLVAPPAAVPKPEAPPTVSPQTAPPPPVIVPPAAPPPAIPPPAPPPPALPPPVAAPPAAPTEAAAAPPAKIVEPPASPAPPVAAEEPPSASPRSPAAPSGAAEAPIAPSGTAVEPPPSRRRGPPIVARGPIVTTPSAVRKAADKLRVETNAGAVVDRCSLLGEVSTGDVRQGIYEIAGHNFLYDNALGLARLKTVEAGGDTLLIREKTKRSVTGDAYRCKPAD